MTKSTKPAAAARVNARASKAALSAPVAKAGKAAANHIVGKVSGVSAEDSKIVAAEKAIATAKLAGLPTKKMEQMLATYRKNNPEEAKPAKGKTAADPDAIKTYKKANNMPADRNVLVQSVAGQKIVFDEQRINKQLNALLGVGKSFAAVEAYLAKQPAVLARGVEARAAPHSSKAIADSKATAAPAAKAAKPAKASAPRSKADNTTKLTVLVKAKDTNLKPGSDRYMRLQAIEGCKTLGEALSRTIADGKKVAMDNIRGMEKRGHVSIG